MFFSNGYVESERRPTSCSSDESDILRELLLEGELASPHHFKTHSLLTKRHTDISIPPICFENAHISRVQPTTGIRSAMCVHGNGTTGSITNNTSGGLSFPSSNAPPPQVINAIISPPRVFIQEFSRLPPPFFHDSVSSVLEHEADEGRPAKTVASIMSCNGPPPPPYLAMPPLKKKKCSSSAAERKQQRCAFPDCPNLRRSAGFCNRHSGKVCSVGDCNKSALSRGKCPEHGGGSRCKRDGCSKFAQTRGLCKSHGGGRQCNVTGCTKNAHQNRLCRSHGGGKRCDFYGCPKWAQRSGYCCAHTKLGNTSVQNSTVTSNTTNAIISGNGNTHLNNVSTSLVPSPHRIVPPFSLLS